MTLVPAASIPAVHGSEKVGVVPANRVFRVLDGLRGLAALLIVVRHTHEFFDPLKAPESFLAVDLFFVMSGIVIGKSYEQRLIRGLSPLRFAWIRLVRLYPLYLLGCFISVVVASTTGITSNMQLIVDIGLALFFIQSFLPGA